MAFYFIQRYKGNCVQQQSDGQSKFLREEIHGKCHDGWLKRTSKKERVETEIAIANKLKLIRATRFQCHDLSSSGHPQRC